MILLGSKEYGGCKYSLETLNHAAVVTAIGSKPKPKEVEHLKSSSEADDRTFLLYSKCRDPDWDQPILPEGQAEIRMSYDLEVKFAVPSLMNELISWRAA